MDGAPSGFENKAASALQNGDWALAKMLAEAALAHSPMSAEAHQVLGVAYWQSGDRDGSVAYLERSVALRPHPVWLNNLGVAYAALGRWDAARKVLKDSLNLRPSDEALAHYGRVLCELACYGEARLALEQAIHTNPGSTTAWIDLGWALTELGEPREGRSALLRGVELSPGTSRAHRLLTAACSALGRADEAAEHARIAADLEPNADAFTRLALMLWEAGNLRGSMEAVGRAFALGVGRADLHSGLLYLLQFDPGESGRTLAEAHLSWAITHCRPDGPAPVFSAHTDSRRKLRVGYLTAELFSSPVQYTRLPLLANSNAERFDVLVYECGPSDGSEERRRPIPAVFRNVQRASDTDLLNIIRSDRLDVLVDLIGHHSFGRLPVLAQRAAPIQIAYTSYPGTTGVAEVDFLLTDESTSPLSTEPEYVERLWRMPSGHLMYAPPTLSPPISALPARRNAAVTFGLFQRAAKLNESCWGAIAAVLASSPDSRLLVHHESAAFDFEEGQSPERILAALDRAGVAWERVVFRGKRPIDEHLRTLAEADIALDTFPYNGHTITCECLWMGVPVVTLSGDRHAGRIGAGLLHQVGLDEWVAHSVDEYISIATTAALDLPRLGRLRASLRSRLGTSTLLDTNRRTREIEGVYLRAWDNWRQAVTGAN